MCLTINETRTKRFVARDKRKIKLKKVVRCCWERNYAEGTRNLVIKTPHRYITIEAGWLKANSETPQIRKDGKNRKISGGAIHAYTKYSAKRTNNLFVLDCWAYAEDYIAHGKNEDVCFKKIWIPIEEYERVIRTFKKRGK